MYNLQEDLGKVKSIKLSNGVELVASILAIDEDKGFINLGEPRVVVIIPARGGSKRLKRKNLYNVWNKPMIYWSIIAAKNLN